jgi:photosystem II stability/assembly factor-like uncharacterized protein
MKTLRTLLFPAICLLAILVGAGCSKSSSSTAETKFVGWAVGGVDNGYGSILSTDNDGLSWGRQGEPTRMPAVKIMGVNALSEMDAWVVGDVMDGYGLIMHTTNGGVLWNRKGSASSLPEARFNAVYAVDYKTVWFAGDSTSLYYTDDQGETFHKVIPDSAVSVNFNRLTASATKLWVAGSPVNSNGSDTVSMVLCSANKGTTWTVKGTFWPEPIVDLSAVNDSLLFAAGGGVVYKTKNGGLSWQKVLIVVNHTINGVYAIDASNIWAVGNKDAIYHSSNGGSKWDTVYSSVKGFDFYGITAADPFRLWITGANSSGIGPGVILYTRNSGSTWISPDVPVSAPIFKSFFPNTSK